MTKYIFSYKSQYSQFLYKIKLHKFQPIAESIAPILSKIIPKSLLVNNYFKDIREYLLNYTKVIELLTITEKVFEDAEVGSSLILTYELTPKTNLSNIVHLLGYEKVKDFLVKQNEVENFVTQELLLNNDKAEIVIQSSDSNSIFINT